MQEQLYILTKTGSKVRKVSEFKNANPGKTMLFWIVEYVNLGKKTIVSPNDLCLI